MDAKDAGTEFSSMLGKGTDELVKLFGEGSAKIAEMARETLGIEVAKDFKVMKDATTTETNTETKTVKVEHTVNATDAISGFYQKEWTLNPERWVQGKGYLDPN